MRLDHSALAGEMIPIPRRPVLSFSNLASDFGCRGAADFLFTDGYQTAFARNLIDNGVAAFQTQSLQDTLMSMVTQSILSVQSFAIPSFSVGTIDTDQCVSAMWLRVLLNSHGGLECILSFQNVCAGAIFALCCACPHRRNDLKNCPRYLPGDTCNSAAIVWGSNSYALRLPSLVFTFVSAHSIRVQFEADTSVAVTVSNHACTVTQAGTCTVCQVI